ncbi:helix-turn-helix domain-containing protein [Actinomadura madurae]|uniref:helix-turn-helix domain-containing protein n=1 Tax=Actinomadura madurae TaxID=1993 RepID=UPI003557A109
MIAAERLHIHEQTVRYRLRRLTELTGGRFTEPEGPAGRHADAELAGADGPRRADGLAARTGVRPVSPRAQRVARCRPRKASCGRSRDRQYAASWHPRSSRPPDGRGRGTRGPARRTGRSSRSRRGAGRPPGRPPRRGRRGGRSRRGRRTRGRWRRARPRRTRTGPGTRRPRPPSAPRRAGGPRRGRRSRPWTSR